MRWDRGSALLLAQFLCIGAVLWPYGEPVLDVPGWLRTVGGALVLVGLVIGLLGAGLLGRSLRAHPAPSSTAVLRTTGVYGLVRHPIYAGVLSGMLGLALQRGRVEPLVAYVVLAFVLHVKSRFEEGLLRDRFGDAYVRYGQSVGAIIPGVGRYPRD